MADLTGIALSKRRIANVSTTYRWTIAPLVIGIVARLFTFISADLTVWLEAPKHFAGPFAVWLREDASWYLSIAGQGYSFSTTGQSQANFFPLYPLTIKLVQPLTSVLSKNSSYLIAGMLVSWITFCVACVLLYRLVYDRFDHATALGTVLLFASFPFSFFYGAIYTESLFIMLALLAFLGIERRNWWLAGVAAMLASSERPPGLFIGACVVLAYALDWLRTRHPLRWDILALALTPLGTAAYAFYCWLKFGTPLAYSQASRVGWHGGYLQSGAIRMAWAALRHPKADPVLTIYVVLFILFVLSLIPIQRLLGLPYTLYALASLISPIATFPNIHSLGRYLTVIFPTFIVVSYGLRRMPRLRIALVVLSVFYLWLFTVLFLTVGNFLYIY